MHRFPVPVMRSMARTELPSQRRLRQRRARSTGRRMSPRGRSGRSEDVLRQVRHRNRWFPFRSFPNFLAGAWQWGQEMLIGLVSREFQGENRGIISLAGDHSGLQSLSGCHLSRAAVSAAARLASLTSNVQPPPQPYPGTPSANVAGGRALPFKLPAPVGPASAESYVPPHGVLLIHGRNIPNTFKTVKDFCAESPRRLPRHIAEMSAIKSLTGSEDAPII